MYKIPLSYSGAIVCISLFLILHLLPQESALAIDPLQLLMYPSIPVLSLLPICQRHPYPCVIDLCRCRSRSQIAFNVSHYVCVRFLKQFQIRFIVPILFRVMESEEIGVLSLYYTSYCRGRISSFLFSFQKLLLKVYVQLVQCLHIYWDLRLLRLLGLTRVIHSQ